MGNVEVTSIERPDWSSSPIILGGNDYVHLYKVSLADEIFKLHRFQALVSFDERLIVSRYVRKQDQDRFTIGRGFLRAILSRYTGIAPLDLQFNLGAGKKPYIQNNVSIFFNISHSLNWVLVAVSNKDVGVDIEFIDPDFSPNEVVHEYFSSAEVNYLDTQPNNSAFYTLWTRKEAFLKATGQGIGDHLKFSPSLNGRHELDPQLSGSDRNWKVLSFMLNPNYVCAVASESEAISYIEYPF